MTCRKRPRSASNDRSVLCFVCLCVFGCVVFVFDLAFADVVLYFVLCFVQNYLVEVLINGVDEGVEEEHSLDHVCINVLFVWFFFRFSCLFIQTLTCFCVCIL